MIVECNRHWQYTDTESNLVMPWYTLPTLQWLKSINTSEWSVFEYGAGYSTLWWRINSAYVSGIESNEKWASAMKVEHSWDEESYVESILSEVDLDCIIVDGIYREKCVAFCLPFIKPGGYLIIDNYGDEDYNPAETAHLLENWECTIYPQPNHSTWKTAVFKKPIA